MKTKGIAMFQYHREDDTPSPTYENKLGFFNGARVWLVRRLHYSLVEMAKANGLKPDEYYRYILERLPYAEAVEDMEALLPWNVKAALEKNSD
jgi:hypothetical protein